MCQPTPTLARIFFFVFFRRAQGKKLITGVEPSPDICISAAFRQLPYVIRHLGYVGPGLPNKTKP